jgi:hypothetical protein
MKRNLLIVSLLLSGAASAQFTQANEPAIGAAQGMYELEETADPYESMTGAGQTWDYSSYFGLTNTPRGFGIEDPSATPEGSYFPSATKAVVIENYMTTYLSSSASSRNSEGFAFTDAGSGTTYRVILDTDNELLMNYPFALGNSLTDAFAGQVDGLPLAAACNGNNEASVDGEGTLILNSSTSITNVMRYKLVDTAYADFGLGQAQLTRTQYEYYKPGTNNDLPLFVHATMTIDILGQTITVVLSSVEPDGYLNTAENTLTGVTVSPNPATDVLSVKGLKNTATLTLVDIEGKTILTTTAEPGVATLNIDQLNAGVYFLHIVDGEESGVERVVIK